MKHLTLKEIARKSGFHYTTVARALKDNPLLKKETRQKIQRIAEEMGYRPDPMLQALVRYRRDLSPNRNPPTIAYLSHHREGAHGGMAKGGEVSYLDGIRAQAEKLGYRINPFWHGEPGISDQRWSQIFLARNIRMIITANFPIELVDLKLDWSEFSAVKISVNPSNLPVDTVSCNQMQTVRHAFQIARLRGFRRIGFLYDERTDVRLGRMWSAGYLVEQQTIPRRERVPLLELFGSRRPEDLRALVEKHKLDVLMSYAHAHLEMLEEAGFRIPEDLGYINLALSCDEEEPISGMQQSTFEVGVSAVNHVTKLYESNMRGFPRLPSIQYIDSVWVEGTTLGRTPTEGEACSSGAPKSEVIGRMR